MVSQPQYEFSSIPIAAMTTDEEERGPGVVNTFIVFRDISSYIPQTLDVGARHQVNFSFEPHVTGALPINPAHFSSERAAG